MNLELCLISLDLNTLQELLSMIVLKINKVYVQLKDDILDSNTQTKKPVTYSNDSGVAPMKKSQSQEDEGLGSEEDGEPGSEEDEDISGPYIEPNITNSSRVPYNSKNNPGTIIHKNPLEMSQNSINLSNNVKLSKKKPSKKKQSSSDSDSNSDSEKKHDKNRKSSSDEDSDGKKKVNSDQHKIKEPEKPEEKQFTKEL